MDLAVASKGDSQEICFVPNGDYAAFMDAYLKEKGVAVERTSGEIVTTEGRTLGRHEGVHHFTVGQRKGLGIATGEPLYVIATDPASQRVTVGGNVDLQCARFVAKQVNWISIAGVPPGATVRAQVKIRNKHAAAEATLCGTADADRVEVRFDQPAARHHPRPGSRLLRRRPRARRRLDRIGYPHLIFGPTIASGGSAMFGMLAVLVYLLAMGIPIYLLYRFQSQAWYWHTLSVLAAVGMGFTPIPAEFQKPEFDLLFGFVFITLMIWGAGGLILFRPHEHHHPHHEKHA